MVSLLIFAAHEFAGQANDWRIGAEGALTFSGGLRHIGIEIDVSAAQLTQEVLATRSYPIRCGKREVIGGHKAQINGFVRQTRCRSIQPDAFVLLSVADRYRSSTCRFQFKISGKGSYGAHF